MQKAPSSDESGLETKPLPPKKRRLRNSKEYNDVSGGLYPRLQVSVPVTRSTRQSQR